MRPLLAGLCCLILLSGCGTRLTCEMWEDDLPRRQPAKAAVITAKVVATPVTVVVDGTTAIFSDPEFWLEVVGCLCDASLRMACR